MANEAQTANEILEVLVGRQAKAIWLSARIDEIPLAFIAKEHEKSVGEVKEILSSVDFALIQIGLAPHEREVRPTTVAINGFHQLEDGE